MFSLQFSFAWISSWNGTLIKNGKNPSELSSEISVETLPSEFSLEFLSFFRLWNKKKNFLFIEKKKRRKNEFQLESKLWISILPAKANASVFRWTKISWRDDLDRRKLLFRVDPSVNEPVQQLDPTELNRRDCAPTENRSDRLLLWLYLFDRHAAELFCSTESGVCTLFQYLYL